MASGEHGYAGVWPCPIVFGDGAKLMLDGAGAAAVEAKLVSLIQAGGW